MEATRRGAGISDCLLFRDDCCLPHGMIAALLSVVALRSVSKPAFQEHAAYGIGFRVDTSPRDRSCTVTSIADPSAGRWLSPAPYRWNAVSQTWQCVRRPVSNLCFVECK